jgi:hypothetical protein
LALRLNNIGVEDTAQTIANKISRGTFSFTFFLQCMEVLGVNDIKID